MYRPSSRLSVLEECVFKVERGRISHILLSSFCIAPVIFFTISATLSNYNKIEDYWNIL